MRATATRVGSPLSTVWLSAQVATDERSVAAVLSAVSFALRSDSVVFCAVRLVWRSCSRGLARRSSAMSCSTIADVSTPDASPESPVAMA